MSARISASVYTSHVPAIGVAIDLGKTDEPYWRPLFDGYDRHDVGLPDWHIHRRKRHAQEQKCHCERSSRH